MRRAGWSFLALSLLAALLGVFFALSDQRDSQAAAYACTSLLGEWNDAPVVTLPESGEKGRQIGDTDYLGILTIDQLSLTLPVAASWSDRQAKRTPCRYSGSLSGQDLILAAHNYPGHFGWLSRLEPGDAVQFTDSFGNPHLFTVERLETIKGGDVNGMESGDWDLTLFTCTYGGTKRLAVRCSRQS